MLSLVIFVLKGSIVAKSLQIFCAVVVLGWLTSTCLFAKEKSLELSIFPYLTPVKIIKHNKKLKEYLSKELHRPVSIITARNFRTYVQKVKSGSYDFLFTAPHVGRFAQVKAGYQPIAMTTQHIQGYYVVKKYSKIKTLRDLKNKTISMASSIAIIHQIAVQDLKMAGIEMGQDIKHYLTKGHTNAIIALLKGHSDVALSGVNMWKKLEPKYKSQLRILQEGTKVPGFLIMAHADIKPELVSKIRQSLLKFHESEEGQGYLFKGYKNISSTMMKDLDKYTNDLK